MTKKQAQLEQFEKTVVNLKEVLEKLKDKGPDYAFFRDSAIQRFEIAFDVCWKALKEILHDEYGVEIASPKKALQEAFKQGLVENSEAWFAMIDMRNETTHAYNEEFAEKVLSELPSVQSLMEKLLWKLKK